MTRNAFFNQYTTSTEQNLLEDLIIESIQIYGFDVDYLPRISLETDSLYTQYTSSAFIDAIPVEMYVKNVLGFGGEGDFVSRFGLEIRDQVTFTIAKKRFNNEIANASFVSTYSSANVEISNGYYTDESMSISRPREGDVLYFPLANTFFEIKFVEHEEVFYPLGKLQTFDLRCETMEYGGQIFATGNSTLDGYMSGLSLGVESGNTSSGANNVAGAINFDIQREFDQIVDFTENDPFASGQY
tara:strand:+ start:20690 stop:21418 length:729 start_codon:yes stop_codon:yes gene_type:complete